MDKKGKKQKIGNFMFKKIIFSLTLLALSGMCFNLPQVHAQSNDAIEVQIPKPKFEIFRAWEYSSFWKWDEKDPRFFRDFLIKIHNSLSSGPF
ncbi:MAG: hypothetical protein PF689_02135 [Deltaproteobacteria bacterium]|nr:hypothetical protein [Deltaproteobacteria bacterium]